MCAWKTQKELCPVASALPSVCAKSGSRLAIATPVVLSLWDSPHHVIPASHDIFRGVQSTHVSFTRKYGVTGMLLSALN